MSSTDLKTDNLPKSVEEMRPEQEEPKEAKVKLNDLPELPFEKILSYLSLEDRIKAKAVSRRWYKVISSFRVKILCLSQRLDGLVRSSSIQNFICKPRFVSFLQTFSQSVGLFNLKYFRLCDVRLSEESKPALIKTLNSFVQLEKLDIVQFDYYWHYTSWTIKVKMRERNFELNLPMLNSIQLRDVFGIKKLTLDAPRLKKAQVVDCDFIRREDFDSDEFLRLHLVCSESVEWLTISDLEKIKVKKLKNLKFLYIYIEPSMEIDSTLMSSLKQLKEIHLSHHIHIEELFAQKQRYNRIDLKIFFCGLLLDGANDPAIDSLHDDFNEETIACLAANPSRLAQEISICKVFNGLDYRAIQRAPRGTEISLLKRFTDLNEIRTSSPVQDIERFLAILKSLDNIAKLEFDGDQPQALFDRLPEHCAAVRELMIRSGLSDCQFLFRLKHLFKLDLACSIDLESVRKIFEEMQFFCSFAFKYVNKGVNKGVRIVVVNHHPKLFDVYLSGLGYKNGSDLDAAIQSIENLKGDENPLLFWKRKNLM